MSLTNEMRTEEAPAQIDPLYTEDYTILLEAFELSSKPVEYYLQVGEITQVQGWIIHLSVIMPQLDELLMAVIPFLKKERVSFKIPVHKYMSDGLLHGACGYNKQAKLVCIYPESDIEALAIAKELIRTTAEFKAPDIPTDYHLGACVYTRYGAFNPVVNAGSDGGLHNYIYDGAGNLVEDMYAIPFVLPAGATWPFEKIKALEIAPRRRFLNDRIKTLTVIKPDVKGNVVKGQYMKNWFRMKYCVVKEGKRYMFMDKWGRDIQDRLQWQLKLHLELYQHVPIPAIIDYFKEQNDVYLAMEYIDGISLDDKIYAIYEGRHWMDLPVDKKVILLDYLLRILQILYLLHAKGYVHRDLSPYNFIIDAKGKMHMIDLELVYSFTQQIPDPAFRGGTEGFMSPEQVAHLTPTVMEDVYGIGALMILFFTNLSPQKFEVSQYEVLKDQLLFFVPDNTIAELITNCLHSDPNQRPNLSIVQSTITQYRIYILQPGYQTKGKENWSLDRDAVTATIYRALNGINSEKMTHDKLWFSKTEQKFALANQQQTVCVLPGLYQGMAGGLWMLSELNNAGLSLSDQVNECYVANQLSLQNEFLPNLQNLTPGLYNGSAGIAIALSGFWREKGNSIITEQQASLQMCLKQDVMGPELLNGAAGQGIALLYCQPYLPDDFVNSKLEDLEDMILSSQQSDGAWLSLTANNQKKIRVTGLAEGASGIVCFLLQLFARSGSEPIAYTAIKALAWLQKQVQKNGNCYTWPVHTLNKQPHAWVYSGGAGIALTFIRAYEVLQDPVYKEMAIGALNCYPIHVSDRDQSYSWGLAGLGQVYLEAARVFGEERWRNRAYWIADLLLHLQKREHEDLGYWLPDALCSLPTADLMTGNSGIIHFLARCLYPEKIKYPLL